MLFQNKILESQKETRNIQNELHLLSSHSKLRGVEFFTPNEYYGLDLIFKAFMSLQESQPLYFALPHGAETGSSKNLALYSGVEAVPVLIYNNEIGRMEIKRRRSPGWAIQGEHGFLILLELLSYFDRLPEFSTNAREILFFPPHVNNTSWKIADPNEDYRTCQELILNYNSTERVDISLPTSDLIAGRDRVFRNHGFRVVSCGSPNDSKFLNRFLNLISDYSKIASKTLGSHIYFARAIGKEVEWLGPLDDTNSWHAKKIHESGELENTLEINRTTVDFIRTLDKPVSVETARKLLGERGSIEKKRWLELQKFGRTRNYLPFSPREAGIKIHLPRPIRRKIKFIKSGVH